MVSSSWFDMSLQSIGTCQCNLVTFVIYDEYLNDNILKSQLRISL